MNKSQYDRLFDAMDEMIVLCAKKVELMKQLKRAYRIAELVGVHPKDLTGVVKTHTIPSGRMYRPWVGVDFAVTIDGNTQKFPLKDVHHDLWPEDILAQYKRSIKKTRVGHDR